VCAAVVADFPIRLVFHGRACTELAQSVIALPTNGLIIERIRLVRCVMGDARYGIDTRFKVCENTSQRVASE
jgi:hypothetical protein